MFFFKKKKPKVKATIITQENFQSLVLDNEEVVLLDFWASWCGPCKVMTPIVDELARDFEDQPIMIGKVNTEQETALAQHFQIKSIPTIMFIKDKKIVHKMQGLVPKPNLAEMIQQFVRQNTKNKPEKKEGEESNFDVA